MNPLKLFILNTKMYMEPQKTLSNNLEKKEQIWRHYTFQLFLHEITVIKTAWYYHIARHTDKQNKIKSPEINPCIYVDGQIIFGNGAKRIQYLNQTALRSPQAKE